MNLPNGSPTVEDVYEALNMVKDPCMVAGGHDLSILDLGLVYSVEAKDGHVKVDMTLTEVGCIFTHRVFGDVYEAIEALTGVKEVEVVPRWTPVWTEERLNQKARTALEGSRTAMSRTINRRSLNAYERSEGQREDLRVAPRETARGI